MRLNELMTESLAYKEMAMGLSQYAGDEYTLIGGYRSGGSSSNYTRLRYDIIDHQLYDKTNDAKKATVGHVEVFVNGNNGIEGLVNIDIKSKGAGYGSKVINDLVELAGGSLRIYDIQKSAIGFWEKMGATFTPTEEYSAVIGKQ